MSQTYTSSLPDPVVYIVDDDEAVRDSLQWLLEANGFGARSFASAEDFLAMLRASAGPAAVSCLVVDVRMPGMTGPELHDELVRSGYKLPLIFITGHGDVPMAVASMKKGAVDFLEKPFNDAQLCALVQQSLESASRAHQQGSAERAAAERLERLTARERQVLDLIVAGRLNKQIADDLGISIKTVEAHRANIMDKLDTRTMADLMKTALRAAGS